MLTSRSFITRAASAAALSCGLTLAFAGVAQASRTTDVKQIRAVEIAGRADMYAENARGLCSLIQLPENAVSLGKLTAANCPKKMASLLLLLNTAGALKAPPKGATAKVTRNIEHAAVAFDGPDKASITYVGYSENATGTGQKSKTTFTWAKQTDHLVKANGHWVLASAFS